MVFLPGTHICLEIYILRHGIAGDRGPQYPDDSKRPLTPAGRQKMREVARGMKALGLTFDAVLSSPYTRARQTAEIAAKALGHQKIHLTKNLAPDAPFEKLSKEICTSFPKSRAILLVGHEPHLSQLIAFFLKSQRMIAIEFKKGGLCRLSTERLGDMAASLHWLLTPDQLCRIGRSKKI